MGGTWVKFQCSGVGQGYLGQSATGSDSRRTPWIAWLIADTDPLGTHNGIAWMTGANDLVDEWWACHMGTERPLSPVIDRTIWMGASCLWGRGRGPEQGTPEALGCQPQCSQLLVLGPIWVAVGTWGHLAPGPAEDAVIQALRVQVLHRHRQL